MQPSKTPFETDVDVIHVTFSYLELPRSRFCDHFENDQLQVVEIIQPDVSFYRFLYNNVGERWLWWRHRVLNDEALGLYLARQDIHIFAFYRNGQPFGYFELETSVGNSTELAYFGLLPFALGKGYGKSALNLALRTAFQFESSVITVHTCTADHELALQTYLNASFSLVGTKEDTWYLPRSLGFAIPQHLLGGGVRLP